MNMSLVQSIGEVVDTNIQVVGYSEQCMKHVLDRPCPKPRPEALVTENDLPPDGHCPCPIGYN